MSILGKPFALAMFPLGILIVLEETNVFTLDIGISKVLLASVLMIIFQIIHMMTAKTQNQHLGIMQIFTAVIFILPGLAFIASEFFGFFAVPSISLIIGVMVFVEALYALH